MAIIIILILVCVFSSWQVNYSMNKSKYLIRSSGIIVDKYQGEIPDT